MGEIHSTEEAAMDAVPGWATETLCTIGRHKMVLLTKDLPKERYEEARRTIAKLETIDYLAAIEPHAAWGRRQA